MSFLEVNKISALNTSLKNFNYIKMKLKSVQNVCMCLVTLEGNNRGILLIVSSVTVR